MQVHDKIADAVIQMDEEKREERPSHLQMSLDELGQCLWRCGKSQMCDDFVSCEVCPAYIPGEPDDLKDTFDVLYRVIPDCIGRRKRRTL